MYFFEKNITQLLEKNKVAFDFDEGEHLLLTDKLKLQFLPNISEVIEQPVAIEQAGLIRLWEDVYNAKTPQVESRISSLLGLNERIHGRETVVKTLENDTYAEFLNQHHLMGATKSKYRLGLYHKQKLVAVAGFGRECPIDFGDKSYRSSELIRFCNKSGTTVVGGLTKLLDHFIRNNKVEHLMTYVDREWSSGDLFRRIGFKQIAVTASQQFCISPLDGVRYRKAELDALNTDYSVWQVVENLGNYKFIKIFV